MELGDLLVVFKAAVAAGRSRNPRYNGIGWFTCTQLRETAQTTGSQSSL